MIELPPDEDLGPAMRLLSPAHRQFVLAYIADGGDCLKEAAAAAGYGTTEGSQRVAGHRLFKRADVQAAILEEARALGKAGLVKAVLTEQMLLERSDQPAVQLKAAENIQNRHGMAVAQKVEVTHTIQTKTTAELEDELRRLREDIAAENENVAARLPPSVIEGEFTEADPNDLSDLFA